MGTMYSPCQATGQVRSTATKKKTVQCHIFFIFLSFCGICLNQFYGSVIYSLYQPGKLYLACEKHFILLPRNLQISIFLPNLHLKSTRVLSLSMMSFFERTVFPEICFPSSTYRDMAYYSSFFAGNENRLDHIPNINLIRTEKVRVTLLGVAD